MKIVINTAHQRFGGAVQVALSFIIECKAYPEHEYHVWLGAGVGKLISKNNFPSNFYFYEFNFGVIDFNAIRNIQKTLAKFESKIRPQIIISTSGPSYFKSEVPQVIGYNLPLYIYPESPYVKNMPLLKKLKLTLKKQAHIFFFKRDAVAYVTQTDDVNKRVKKLLNTRHVYTVSNTANSFFDNWEKYKNKLPAGRNNTFRFICISSYYNHKNLDLIPLVLKKLSDCGVKNVEFVTTLKDKDFKQKIGSHKNIINVGPVKPKECPSLYKECDALFLPTLAECFSASYPEAMIMEKPIITTDLPFAKSICGPAALYFKPQNAKDATSKIKKLINDKELQNQLVFEGKERLKNFDSPEKRAEKYLYICFKYKVNI
jgi:glycosyltransferase involved in cell wall biosynthesis